MAGFAAKEGADSRNALAMASNIAIAEVQSGLRGRGLARHRDVLARARAKRGADESLMLEV